MTVEYFSWGGGDAYDVYAAACITAMAEARPTCDECSILNYAQAIGAAAYLAQSDDNPGCRHPSGAAVDSRLREVGYEMMHGCPGYVRRCAPCHDIKLYPWADKLNVEQVALVMQTMFEGGGKTMLACAELKGLVEPYRYPAQTGIEHGQVAHWAAFVLKPEELTDAASLAKQTEAKRGNIGPNVREFF